jgi:acetyl-CoA acetyltransferase
VWITGVCELRPEAIAACEEPIEAAALALTGAARDAGLHAPAAIDGLLVYDSITTPHLMAASKLAEYLGLRPAYAATVGAGGASPVFALILAAGLVRLGAARTVAVVHADLRGGAGRRADVISRMAGIVGHPQFEDPLGPTVAGLYGLLAAWLLHERAATPADLAEIAVSARAWAAANPAAHQRAPLSEREVLEAPRVAGPLGRLDCCLITDLAGSVIVSREPPGAGAVGVRLIGSGGAVTHEEISQLDVVDPLAGARAAAAAVYAASGLSAAEIDAAYLYDSFTVTVALQLLAYGLDRGAGLHDLLRRTGTGPGGRLPVNTHGGLLSAVTGGLSHVIEAVRQLRGQATGRQLDGVRHALVTGVGGVFSHHAAIVLGASDA